MEIKPVIDPKEVALDTAIDADDLNSEFLELSGRFFFYSAKMAKADAQANRAKQRMEIVSAQLDKDIRESADKKQTEAQIKNLITLDEGFQAAQSGYYDAQMIASLCKGAVEALRAKRDSLIQLGANHREETKGNLRTRVSPSQEATEALQKTARLVG